MSTRTATMISLPARRVYRAVGWLASAVLVVAAWLGAGAARAADYGAYIEIETEEDLLDLLSAGEIDETAYELLVELLHDGVNVNAADREELYSLPNLTYAHVDAILQYRADAGSIVNPGDLVAADVLDEGRLYAILPFLVIGDPDRGWAEVHGRLQYATTYVTSDDEVPSMWLGARLAALKHLDAGFVGVLTRTRLSDVVYDPNRDALSARAPAVRFHPAKYFLAWEADTYHLVAGTYRIGFGQRLTFDNTDRYTPNGIRLDEAVTYSQDLGRRCRESAGELSVSPCTGPAAYEYRSPDYRWTDRLRGAAVGLRRLDVGAGWLQAYGWASYQTSGIYQYEIYDRDRCADPTDDGDEACTSPTVYRRSDQLLAPSSAWKTSTLPDMYDQLVAGGNVSVFLDRRSHIGVTGYGAETYWLVDGVDLDFQEWSRTPYGGPFGAVGLDGSWGWSWLDLFAEVTRSLDSQPAGGGWAALARGTATWARQEVELLVRYYDPDYANPYARPLAAADEFDGLRARDEVGVRLRYAGEVIQGLQLRAGVDLWSSLRTHPGVADPTERERPLKLQLASRISYQVTRWFRPGVWFEYQDRHLAHTSRDQCYEFSTEEVEGEPVPCAGEKTQAGVQLRFQPIRRLTIALKGQHRAIDDGGSDYEDDFRHDLAAWLTLGYAPIEALRLRANLRYLHEALDDDGYLEQSVWFYVEAAYWYERYFRVKVRYELYSWLDDRGSTDQREPNPAHWIRLELEARF